MTMLVQEFDRPGGDREGEVPGTIFDRTGRPYRSALRMGDRSHDWQVFDDGWRIGYAWCSRDQTEFRINDLKFDGQFRRPRTFLGWQIGRARVVNYQRRGLGTALLRVIITHARAHGCRQIVGMISQVDLDRFSTLPGWYARFGFVYSPKPDGGIIKGLLHLVL